MKKKSAKKEHFEYFTTFQQPVSEQERIRILSVLELLDHHKEKKEED